MKTKKPPMQGERKGEAAMKITVELLKEKGACENGIEAFAKLFPPSEYPDGVEINEETVAKAAEAKVDTSLIWWLYNNLQQDARLYTLCAVYNSKAVDRSEAVDNSKAVDRSKAVSWSEAVYRSEAVDRSKAVSWSFGVINSYGVDNALFLADKERVYSIFGKRVVKDRFEAVKGRLYELLGKWRPTYTNIKALYLANGSDWKLTPIENAKELQTAEAWAGMPQAAVDYVRSLPEFDAAMFAKITGIHTEGNHAE